MRSIERWRNLLPLGVLAVAILAGCATEPGVPAENYHARATDESYNVKVSGGVESLSYVKDSTYKPELIYSASRRIVFRGERLAVVPKDIRDAIVRMELIYCELLAQRDRVLKVSDQQAAQARADYLASVNAKIRPQAAQNVATNTDQAAFVSPQMQAKVQARADDLARQAQEVHARQTNAVNLLAAKLKVETFRVFETDDGPKYQVLP